MARSLRFTLVLVSFFFPELVLCHFFKSIFGGSVKISEQNYPGDEEGVKRMCFQASLLVEVIINDKPRLKLIQVETLASKAGELPVDVLLKQLKVSRENNDPSNKDSSNDDPSSTFLQEEIAWPGIPNEVPDYKNPWFTVRAVREWPEEKYELEFIPIKSNEGKNPGHRRELEAGGDQMKYEGFPMLDFFELKNPFSTLIPLKLHEDLDNPVFPTGFGPKEDHQERYFRSSLMLNVLRDRNKVSKSRARQRSLLLKQITAHERLVSNKKEHLAVSLKEVIYLRYDFLSSTNGEYEQNLIGYTQDLVRSCRDFVPNDKAKVLNVMEELHNNGITIIFDKIENSDVEVDILRLMDKAFVITRDASGKDIFKFRSIYLINDRNKEAGIIQENYDTVDAYFGALDTALRDKKGRGNPIMASRRPLRQRLHKLELDDIEESPPPPGKPLR